MSNLKHLYRIVGRIKALTFTEIGQRIHPCGANLYQKVEILHFSGAVYPLHAPTRVKFRSAKQTYVPLGHTKFDVNRCNELPLRGENADFQPLSKFNTGSLLQSCW